MRILRVHANHHQPLVVVLSGPSAYDVIFDVAATRSLRDLRRMLLPGGTLVCAGAAKRGGSLGILARLLAITFRSRVLHQRVVTYIGSTRREDLSYLKQLIEAGQLRPAIDRTYPLAEAGESVRYTMGGQGRAKVVITMGLSSEDIDELRYAKRLLERPGLAARIANAFGTPVEKLFEFLPDNAAEIIRAVTNKALTAAVNFATSTIAERHSHPANWLHKTAVAITGAAGGAPGITTLAAELPATTIIMLRSIADIARSEGEDIKSPEARLACLEVFALSGSRQADDATESGYFAVRTTLAKALSQAAEYITERGVAREGAPALVRFVSQVAARFGVSVSEKVMAQSVPVIGAAGGAMINLLFIDHFQDVARGHFIVRRLERKYGPGAVKRAYLAL
jgi:hypothetical protein